MHLSVSLNELLKLTDVAPAIEVSGGGSEGGSDSKLEFTSEFFDAPFLTSVEGEEKQITRPGNSVASEIPARDLWQTRRSKLPTIGCQSVTMPIGPF